MQRRIWNCDVNALYVCMYVMYVDDIIFIICNCNDTI